MKRKPTVLVIAATPDDLRSEAERHFPGVADLLAVYGGYEQMVRQVESYLSLTQPPDYASTSNSSA